jgi:hypothetical protein
VPQEGAALRFHDDVCAALSRFGLWCLELNETVDLFEAVREEDVEKLLLGAVCDAAYLFDEVGKVVP